MPVASSSAHFISCHAYRPLQDLQEEMALEADGYYWYWSFEREFQKRAEVRLRASAMEIPTSVEKNREGRSVSEALLQRVAEKYVAENLREERLRIHSGLLFAEVTTFLVIIICQGFWRNYSTGGFTKTLPWLGSACCACFIMSIPAARQLIREMFFTVVCLLDRVALAPQWLPVIIAGVCVYALLCSPFKMVRPDDDFHGLATSPDFRHPSRHTLMHTPGPPHTLSQPATDSTRMRRGDRAWGAAPGRSAFSQMDDYSTSAHAPLSSFTKNSLFP